MSHDLISDRWDDLRIASTARAGTSSPGLLEVNSTGIYAWKFQNAADELHFSIQLPHGWNKKMLSPHVHWISDATWSSGSVTWRMEYIIGKPQTGSAWSAKQTIEGTGLTSGTAYQSQWSDITDISPSSISSVDYTSPSTLMLIKLSVPTNTMNNSALPFLVEFDFHFQRHHMGTINESMEP